MDEISQDELFKGLLAYGYFPETIPPVFTSESFYNYCKKKNPVFSDKWHDYVSYSSMRNINIPRQLSIPVPMKYQKLCDVIRNNWGSIQKHFHLQTDQNNYCISRTHLRKMEKTEALFKMNYQKWSDDGDPEADLLIHIDEENSVKTSKYLVEADISTCFPSIYSHAIPWAFVGKAVAKQTAKDDSLWYNQIDQACYKMKSNETHGLLIGPHASNLLSEIVLTVVDKKLSGKYSYIRHIDDYDCYVESYEEGQRFLRDLETELKEFDLPLNHKKTRIISLPISFEKNWKHQLGNYPMIGRHGKTEPPQVNGFIDTALRLSDNDENFAIMNWAIKKLSKQNLTKNAKAVAAKRIMHLAVLYPYLLRLMEENVFIPFDVDKEQIQLFANTVFIEAKKVNNYEAVSYAIYYALKYDFWLCEEFDQWAIDQNDCITLLMTWLYYLKACHGSKTATYTKKLKAEALRIKNSDEMDRHWLFCYEVLSEKQLDDEWQVLKRAKVSFVSSIYVTKQSKSQNVTSATSSVPT